MSVDIEAIKGVPLFAGLTDDQLTAIGAKLEVREASVGEHLSSEGGAGYFFFVLADGSAEVTRGGVVLAEFGPGDFFGEAAIFRARVEPRPSPPSRPAFSTRCSAPTSRSSPATSPNCTRASRTRSTPGVPHDD